MKVLALDNLQKVGIDVFVKEGIEVDVKGKMTPEELASVIDNYDGVVVRGATKATAPVFEKVTRTKVIGRAGSGTDNIDKAAATKKGVVVMNTPGGNTVTTGEHAIALMMALARQLPQATASMKEGKWEKSKFMGTELTDKVLGVVGLGNIGKVVAERGLGLKMVVLGCDPYVTKEDMARLGVEYVALDELYRRSDFITFHTPLTPETKNMVNASSIGKMKKGVFLVNCARGALINEADLQAALESGKVKGAALDVFPVEPPPADTPYFKHPNVILTPHLGASTTEAQEKVAVLIAEQICDFLKKGTIRNSVNFPSVSAELLPTLKPYLELGEKLGAFHGQMLDAPLKELKVEYVGEVGKLSTAPVTISILKGLLQYQTEEVNLVNARMVAEERGVKVTETKAARSEEYTSLVRVHVLTEKGDASLSGTVFGTAPRVVRINAYPIEADLSGGILMLQNQDVPGVVGRVGTFLGEKGINIAGLQLGRVQVGGTAVSLISVDNPVPDPVLKQLSKLPNITAAKYLTF
ncbi:MAG TPA: phosphoglycerate dehydrogenase [Candidatus Limnocylindrales bacterium]|nr:phosphoglycerate dehydrogenase [Candidatus Limnocylindrales bacterium]